MLAGLLKSDEQTEAEAAGDQDLADSVGVSKVVHADSVQLCVIRCNLA